jgi:hypothetical protein
MKRAIRSFAALALTAAGCLWFSAPAPAQNTNAPQRRFASPDEAVTALREAAQGGDRAAVEQIFGPEVKDFLTGDAVQDSANFRGFSQAMKDGCQLTAEGDSQMVLNIGTNQWPFPIPLVKDGQQWFFDTDAGREEVVNRHIGRDEMNAIGVCRAYVKAQIEYFSQARDDSGVQKYAMRFKSSPGKQDGLYWTNGPSPFAGLVAEAYAEGYGAHAVGTGPHPFHGYLFRILTSQGRSAPGGKANYLVNGKLTGGFGLVAFPAKWGRSGIMTFIVNKDGLVYQRDLGAKTADIAAKMTEYNPNHHWTLVQDAGVIEP